MRAGELRNKATLQKIGTTTNAFGEIEQGAYIDYKTVWCSINAVSGRETFLSNADFAKTTHKIRIRYLSGVDASMRLLYAGRVFSFIYTYDYAERRKEIEILATEVNNG